MIASVSHRLKAFSLVEVTVSLGILSFGLIAMLGLIPTGLRVLKESADEAASANIAAALQADILSAPSNAARTERYGIPLVGADTGTELFTQDGKWINGSPPGGGSVQAEPVYAAKWVVRERSGSSPPTALISVAWPALAPEPTGSVEVLLVLPENPSGSPTSP